MKNTVIITGAAGNLGKTITKSLLEQGYKVQAAIGPKDDINFLEHINLKTNKVNLLDASSSNEFIHFINDYRRDEVVALICLVGGFTTGNILETESTTVRSMIDLNFITAYNVTKPMIEHCKKNNKGLQIIFIGSRPAILPEQGVNLIAYGLAKSLLFKFADYINTKTNSTNISASVLVPSTIDTPGTRRAIPDEDPGLWVPMEHLASTISFILSETGQMMRDPVYKIYNKS